jgi:hypothetical protein
MALTAGNIIGLAEKTLVDETNDRWPAADMLAYLNAAISALVVAKPDAAMVTEAFACANSARQTLPAGGIALRNCLVNTTTGRAIRIAERSDLDEARPNWQAMDPDDVPGSEDGVLHYVYDKQDPKVFYLWPKPTAAWSIQICYEKQPTRCANEAATLPVDDIYEVPLWYLTVGYAFLADTLSGDPARGAFYIEQAYELLGIKAQTQGGAAPLPPQKAQVSEKA